jgi:hypothetical protein
MHEDLRAVTGSTMPAAQPRGRLVQAGHDVGTSLEEPDVEAS